MRVVALAQDKQPQLMQCGYSKQCIHALSLAVETASCTSQSFKCFGGQRAKSPLRQIRPSSRFDVCIARHRSLPPLHVHSMSPLASRLCAFPIASSASSSLYSCSAFPTYPRASCVCSSAHAPNEGHNTDDCWTGCSWCCGEEDIRATCTRMRPCR